MKKGLVIVFLLMASQLFAAAWTGSTSEPTDTKRIDGKIFYVITNADELAWFAGQVNDGRSNINAVLANDIVFGENVADYSAAKWVEIENFSGVLDGDGYTIYGLDGRERFVFINVITKEGIVKNLNIRNWSRNARSFVGGNYGTIFNVSNYFEGKYLERRSSGICIQNHGVISHCNNYGEMYAYAYLPTILTASGFLDPSNDMGGIAVSNEKDGIIEFCSNVGRISYTGGAVNGYGGITAWNFGEIKYSFSDIEPTQKNNGTISYSITEGSSFEKVGGSGMVDISYSRTTFAYWINGIKIQSTTENMQKDQFAWILNTSNGTEENSGVWTRGTDGFPTFANEDSLAIRKIVFNDDGVTSNRYTNYRGIVDFPKDPEPTEGFIFSGWFNSENVKVKPSTIFTADQIVNAVYVDASDVYYTINFYNDDNTLLKSYSVQHGSIVSYDGEEPVKASSAEYSYSFAGWNVEPTNAVEDFDYYATYTSNKRFYTIEFRDYDGTLLQTSSNLYGTIPSYSDIPARTSTAEWNYSCKGWKPAIESVSEDAVYTAIYDSSKVEYTVIFMNGSTVFETQQVAYGSPAKAPSEKPSRDGYKFIGWSPSYASITSNLTISALFEELIYHTITIFDNEGNKVDNANVADEELYTLPTAPQKEGYGFVGWFNGDKLLGYSGDKIPVTADLSLTAHYSILSYTVKFVDYDGSILEQKNVKYGEMPKYEGEEPVRKATEKFVFIFTKWSPTIESVTKNATYKAVFDSTEVSGSDKTESTETEKSSSSVKPGSTEIEMSSSSVESEPNENIKSSSSGDSESGSDEELNSSSSNEDNTIIAKKQELQFHLSVTGRNIQVAGAPVGSVFAVMDMQGRILNKGRVTSTNSILGMPSSGSYLLRIGNQTQRVNVK